MIFSGGVSSQAPGGGASLVAGRPAASVVLGASAACDGWARPAGRPGTSCAGCRRHATPPHRGAPDPLPEWSGDGGRPAGVGRLRGPR